MTATLTEEYKLICGKCGNNQIELTAIQTTKRMILKTVIKLAFRIVCQKCGHIRQYSNAEFIKKMLERHD